MPGVTDQALKNCQQAIRNGLKLQQELARYWTGVISQSGLRRRIGKNRVSGFAATSATSIPAAQKRVEEIMELTEKNYKAGADLLKKATDAAQTASVAESQTKWLDVWNVFHSGRAHQCRVHCADQQSPFGFLDGVCAEKRGCRPSPGGTGRLTRGGPGERANAPTWSNRSRPAARWRTRVGKFPDSPLPASPTVHRLKLRP